MEIIADFLSNTEIRIEPVFLGFMGKLLRK